MITVNVAGVDKTLTFPDGTKREVIARTVTDILGRFETERPSVIGATSRAGAEKFINNILQLPNTLGTFIGESAAAIKMGDFSQFGKGEGRSNLPLPTATDIFAGADVVGERSASLANILRGADNPPLETLPEAFGKAKLRQQQLSDVTRASRPIASATGDLLGDAATIATGRLPIRAGLSKIKPPALPKKAIELVSKIRMTPGLPRLLDRVLKTKSVTSLGKAAGRATEAGFEGAALAILNSDDPLETAAFAAGAQGLGTTFLELSKGITSGGAKSAGLKIGLAAVAVGSLIQLVKEATPGGRDRVLESMETGFSKVMFSLLLGGLSGLGGFGRLKGTKFAEDLPILSDMLTSLPRNVVLGTLREVLVAEDEGNNTPGIVLDALSNNPNAFDKDVTALIEKALTQEDVSFVDTVNGLLQTSDVFTKKLTQLR